MKKSKLGRKILIFMMIASLGMSTIVFSVAITEMNRLERLAIQTQDELGENSSAKSSEALLDQAEKMLQVMVNSSADNFNLLFYRVNQQIHTVAGMVNYIYCHSELYQGALPPTPQETENGVLMGRGVIVNGVEPTDDLKEDLGQLTGVDAVLSNLWGTEKLLRSVIIGTEDGLFYRYSDYNDFNIYYDHRNRSWYQEAMAHPGEVVWSDKYTEAYGNEVVTCSMSFNGEDGRPKGVVSMDIAISTLVAQLESSYEEGNFALIVNGKGEMIACPSVVSEEYFRIEGRQEVLDDMMAGGSGVDIVLVNDKYEYIAYAPVNETGWSFAAVVSFDSVTEPAVEAAEEIAAESAEAKESMEELVMGLRQRYINVFIVCTALIVMISITLTEMIRRPIDRLTYGVQRMGQGNLDFKLDVVGKDEIAELGRAFNKMAEDLKKHINDLSAMLEEKHRNKAELDVATQIQTDLLPSTFPAFPERKEFDIYASMDPAREVGGDFYDFFFIDEQHLALVIGDVSGKGIPAALFMMEAKTLIKNVAEWESSPAAILEHVNRQLCENNQANMFVTVWMGIVDVTTGHMRCANAGHEYPMLRTAGGLFELHKDKHGMALGCMDGLKWKEQEYDFAPEDAIFIYTDGVAEAKNASDEFFGTDRTQEALNTQADGTPRELLKRVHAAVNTFVDGADQFDDLTMMCWKRL